MSELLLKKMAKGSIYIFIGMVLADLFNYASKIWIARYFGPVDYGLLSLALSVFGVITVIGLFGFDLGIIRHVSYYRGKKNKSKLKSSVFSTLKLSTITSLIGFVLLFFFSDFLATSVFSKPELALLLKMFAICIPLSILTKISVSILAGLQLVKYKAMIEDFMKNVLIFAFLGASVIFGYGFFGVLVGYIIAYVLIFITSITIMRKWIAPYIEKNIKTVVMTKEMVAFAWPLILSTAIATMIRWTDNILLGVFSTSEQIGIYNSALSTATLLNVIFVAIAYTFVPLASHMYSKKKDISRLFRTISKWTFAIMLPFFLLVAAFSEEIIGILFGGQYLAASTSLFILSGAFLLHCLVGPTNRMFVVINKTKLNLVTMSVGALTNIILNLVLIPVYGIVGAAIGTAAGLLAIYVSSSLLLFKYKKVFAISKKYLNIFVSGFVSIIIYFYLIEFVLPVSGFLKILSFIIFLLIYGSLFFLTKSFSEDDKIILRAVRSKLKI